MSISSTDACQKMRCTFVASSADPEGTYLYLAIDNCSTNYITDVASASVFMEAGFSMSVSNGVQCTFLQVLSFSLTFAGRNVTELASQAEPKCEEMYIQTVCQYVLIPYCI